MAQPTREAPPIVHVRGRVVSADRIPAGYCILVVDEPAIAQTFRPGQLVYVACQSEAEERSFVSRCGAPVAGRKRFSGLRVLRRPFAVAGTRRGCIVLLLKTVGSGSEWLANRKSGQVIDLIGPLGNGFDLRGVRRALLVGGGTGLASLYSLAWHLGGWRISATVVVGARSLEAVPLRWRQGEKGRVMEELDRMGIESILVTEKEDGLLATQPVEDILSRSEPGELHVFACGPWAMMAEVSRLAQGRFRCQVSLEARMGCGVGACRTCAVPVRAGASWTYRTVCRDGPVFAAEEVIWEKPPI